VAGSSRNTPHRCDTSGSGPGSPVAFPRMRVAERVASNLPAELTSFVGRGREVEDLETLLEGEARLVTLTGPGGCGKTRLALSAASRLAGGFEDGVWWVELAPLSDPALVPQAVASAIGVREAPGRSPTEALLEHLESREPLLVLDNCEHLVQCCADLVDTLLRSCPRVRVLATSRETLGIVGERAWLVPSLALPGQQSSIEEMMQSEAINLFAERARAVVSTFELTEHNAPAVARVCRMLDGMPLAIELAAARVRVLSVGQISSRLQDSFALLSGGSRTALPRQRTLKAAIDWSYELLSENERILLGRLSVFAGGWTLEAAEAVGSGGGIGREEVLDLLAHLVDKSMVVSGAGAEGALRYGMLEPVRQYGEQKLEESGEAARVRKRHAEYYLALAEEAEPELKGAGQAQWLGRLERDRGNLRSALGWSSESGNAELGLRLAGALERFWWARGHLSEGRRWLEMGLAGSGESPAAARAQALNEAGWLALWQDDLQRAVEFLEESLDSFEELEDERGIATSLTNLGHAVLHQDDKERLKALSREAETLRERFVDRWAIAELLIFLGMAALYEGDHQRAVALLEESMASFRDLEDTQRVTICVTYLWMAALEGGEHDRAAALLEEDFRRLQRLEIKPRIQIYDGLMGLAVLAALGGRRARATRLCGAAETLREAINLSLLIWDHTPTNFETQLNTARSRLEETAWEAAWAEGRAMSPEEAVDYALSEGEKPGSSPPSTTSYPAGLSAREVEVLRLVAKGLTNPQIAKELFISPRTVDRHLNSVYRKVGVSSRVAAARFATEHDLL